MTDEELSTRNRRLSALLRQAGLDAAARDVAEQIQTVLLDELHHRMKNTLALVMAIVRQSFRTATNLAGAEAAMTTRLQAMTSAHDLLLSADPRAASLRTAAVGALAQHNTAAGRIAIRGDEMEIIPSAVLPISLILNELCTNATKYGALSGDGGSVTLDWQPDAEGKALILRWAERGGPPVSPPQTRSFGTRLIEEAIPQQLGGKGRLDFRPEGLEFELWIPIEVIQPVAGLPGP